MKHPVAVHAMICLIAAGAWAATYTMNPVTVDTFWDDSALWDIGGYPNASGAEVIVSNNNVGGATGARNLRINVPCTVGVVRCVGQTNLNVRPVLANWAQTLYFDDPSGTALVETRATTVAYALELNSAIHLLSDLEVRIVSQSTINVYCDVSGAGDMYLYGTAAPGYMRLSTSSPWNNFSGGVYVYNGADFPQTQANTFLMTNSVVTLGANGLLRIMAGSKQIGKRLVALNNTQIYSYYNYQYWLTNMALEIHGNLNLRADGAANSGRYVYYHGDVSGTGMITCSTGAGFTNRFVGSVSPGLSAGAITFAAGSNAKLLFGQAGSPLLLNIEDGDQVAVSNIAYAVNLADFDVKFLTTTAVGTTNWFLYSSAGFTGGAFTNSPDFGVFSGYCVSNVPGMENYIGVVVVPEPALLLMSLCGALAVRFRR